MTTTNAIIADAERMLADMHRMTDLAAGHAESQDKSAAESFDHLLQLAVSKMDQVEQKVSSLQDLFTVQSKAAITSGEMAVQHQTQNTLRSMLRIREEAIQAYKSIANMQV